MKIFVSLSLLCLILLNGCGQREEPNNTSEFMAIGQQAQQNDSVFTTQTVAIKPQQPIATIEDRRGNATFRIVNNGTTPLAVAKLDTSCSTCRISNRVPRKIPAGGSVDVEVRIAVGLLEQLPSKRFVQVVLLTPDNEVIEGLVTIHLRN